MDQETREFLDKFVGAVSDAIHAASSEDQARGWFTQILIMKAKVELLEATTTGHKSDIIAKLNKLLDTANSEREQASEDLMEAFDSLEELQLSAQGLSVAEISAKRSAEKAEMAPIIKKVQEELEAFFVERGYPSTV